MYKYVTVDYKNLGVLDSSIKDKTTEIVGENIENSVLTFATLNSEILFHSSIKKMKCDNTIYFNAYNGDAKNMNLVSRVYNMRACLYNKIVSKYDYLGVKDIDKVIDSCMCDEIKDIGYLEYVGYKSVDGNMIRKGDNKIFSSYDAFVKKLSREISNMYVIDNMDNIDSVNQDYVIKYCMYYSIKKKLISHFTNSRDSIILGYKVCNNDLYSKLNALTFSLGNSIKLDDNNELYYKRIDKEDMLEYIDVIKKNLEFKYNNACCEKILAYGRGL